MWRGMSGCRRSAFLRDALTPRAVVVALVQDRRLDLEATSSAKSTRPIANVVSAALAVSVVQKIRVRTDRTDTSTDPWTHPGPRRQSVRGPRDLPRERDCAYHAVRIRDRQPARTMVLRNGGSLIARNSTAAIGRKGKSVGCSAWHDLAGESASILPGVACSAC